MPMDRPLSRQSKIHAIEVGRTTPSRHDRQSGASPRINARVLAFSVLSLPTVQGNKEMVAPPIDADRRNPRCNRVHSPMNPPTFLVGWFHWGPVPEESCHLQLRLAEVI